jgi:aminoglycoside phosphotransferase (APT) family kinase protein
MALADFGEQLGWDSSVAVREDVLRTFARLQIQAASQVDRLLGAGCLDRRLAWLAAQAQRWLPTIEETGRLPGIDAATWLSADELAELRAAVPHLTAICGELAAYAIPPSLVHGDLHLSNVAQGPRGYLFFDWTDACVAHPFLDLLTFLQHDEEEVQGALRDRLRDAYLSEWAAFEPAERLQRAWRLAEPLGALNQAIGYQSIVADLEPIERHTARSTAYWLRKVLARLPQAGGGRG